MQCEIHGITLEQVANYAGNGLVCPACFMNERDTIERDSLGRCVDAFSTSVSGRLNFINNKMTPITVGDMVRHRTYGTGTVAHISTDNKMPHPIKIHFDKEQFYAQFNIEGSEQGGSKCVVDFPKVPSPNVGKLGVCTAAEATKSIKEALSTTNKVKTNKWDKRFVELAEHVAQWSKDPSTKVGAVIVDANHRIVSIGFNGYPQNVPDNDVEDRERRLAKILHAEMNALLFAQRSLEGCSIYVWPMPPCSQCMSAIIQSGISNVYAVKATASMHERWGAKIAISEEMCEDACVSLEYLT